jgi:hypothetical protein
VALKAPAVAQPVARPAATSDVPVETPIAVPVAAPPSVARRIRGPVDDKPQGIGLRGIAYGVGTLLILLLGWYFMHSRSASSNDVPKEATVPAPVVQQSAPVATKSSAAGTIAGPSAAVVPRKTAVPTGQGAPVDSRGRWRVIAFTYNSEDQARQKVAAIAQEHPDLNPDVFTPNGHSPFVVTLGGPMSMEDAFAFSGKAKREGMPKDTYAQNYRNQ